jgi:hypothetical protein
MEPRRRFINGDSTAWKRNASQRDDVTIMGAWGAYEKGWKEVGARYDAVAARLKESGAKVRVEHLSSGASGDLAYTVAIERSAVQRVGQDVPCPDSLARYHIFRRRKMGHGNSFTVRLTPLWKWSRQPLFGRSHGDAGAVERQVEADEVEPGLGGP